LFCWCVFVFLRCPPPPPPPHAVVFFYFPLATLFVLRPRGTVSLSSVFWPFLFSRTGVFCPGLVFVSQCLGVNLNIALRGGSFFFRVRSLPTSPPRTLLLPPSRLEGTAVAGVIVITSRFPHSFETTGSRSRIFTCPIFQTLSGPALLGSVPCRTGPLVTPALVSFIPRCLPPLPTLPSRRPLVVQFFFDRYTFPDLSVRDGGTTFFPPPPSAHHAVSF